MAKLQEELRQSKPFASTRQEAFLGLQRTADLVARPVEKLFRRRELTPEQYNVLRILRGAEPHGLPTLEIGKRMITRASNVTRIIDRLETKGLVSRRRDSRDRRIVRIRVAPSGLRAIEELHPDLGGSIEKAMAGLSEAESIELTLLLEKIRAALRGRSRRGEPEK
jgi:DNA-binding MarR family transcriptional regulator